MEEFALIQTELQAMRVCVKIWGVDNNIYILILLAIATSKV